MPDRETVLKLEISLARREARALVEPVKNAILCERGSIATLRSRLMDQANQVGRLEARMREMGSVRPRVSEDTLKKIR